MGNSHKMDPDPHHCLLISNVTPLYLGVRHPESAHHSLAVPEGRVVVVAQGGFGLLHINHLAVGKGFDHLGDVSAHGPGLFLWELVPRGRHQVIENAR